MLVHPVQIGLVLRKALDEILAGHAGIPHAQRHHEALLTAHLVHDLTQLGNHRVENLRRELQLHELVRQGFQRLLRRRVLDTVGFERLEVALVQALHLLQTRSDLLRVRACFRSVFFGIGVVAFFARRLGHRRGCARVRIRDLLIRIDEACDQILQACLAAQDLVVGIENQRARRRERRECRTHLIEAFLDALRDANLAFAGQQLDCAHLAHIHADGVRRATKLGVDGCERGRRFVGGVLVVRHGGIRENQRLGFRCLLIHRDAHVVNHVNDVFDLLRIDDFARQVVVDLAIREVALLLAFRYQQFELGLTFLFLGLLCRRFHGSGVPLCEGRVKLANILV